ncbi:lanthionine synthetase C family protein [Nocardiopsis coralliicola]
MSAESSLGRGAPGRLIAAAAAARLGRAPWSTAHASAKQIASAPASVGVDAGLYKGAPAVVFALHAAGHPGYTGAAERLDAAVLDLIDARLAAAAARFDAGEAPAMGEYDLITGLVGLGAYLHALHPSSSRLEAVAQYLVRLTRPGPAGEPGWWTHQAPTGRAHPAFPDGHANFGLAHGAAGILAMLAILTLHGTAPSGYTPALHRLLDWFDTHQEGSRWPELITPTRPGPLSARPSWCYGAAGIAWAQHLAGHALGDSARCARAAAAMRGALTDAHRLTDPGLCHGTAGLALTATRMGLSPPAAFTGPATTADLMEGQAGIDLLVLGDTTAWTHALLLSEYDFDQRK